MHESKENEMNNNELYQLLDIPEDVIQRLNEYERNRTSTFIIAINDLMTDYELVQNLDKLILSDVGEDTDGIKTLWEELNIARQSFEKCQQKGISLDIFTDTMKFCTRFLLEHHKIYSCYRFVWGWWFPRQLSLREFRIGALEYEFSEEKCIQIHIPSDADLSQQAVLESISDFKRFCKQYYPEWEGKEMYCHSWLLSPALKDILGDNSNILSFQKLFDVVENDEESMAVLDWVFPGFNEISDKLPENTSLQRDMKRYLLEGKKIGWTKGILR